MQENDIVSLVESAPPWEFLEEKIRREIRNKENFLRENDYFSPVFAEKRELTTPVERDDFTRLVRSAYCQAKGTVTKENQKILRSEEQTIDGITLRVHGIWHDDQGQREAAEKLRKNPFIILEPGFSGWYYSPKTVDKMPVSEEYKGISFTKRLRWFYQPFGGQIYMLDPVLLIAASSFSALKNWFSPFFDSSSDESKEALFNPYGNYMFRDIKEEIRLSFSASFVSVSTALFSLLPETLEKTEFTYVNREDTSYKKRTILLRSFMQAEYALMQAKKQGRTVVDLVAGAAHAKDIFQIYATPGVREELKRVVEERMQNPLIKARNAIPDFLFTAGVLTLHAGVWYSLFSYLFDK